MKQILIAIFMIFSVAASAQVNHKIDSTDFFAVTLPYNGNWCFNIPETKYDWSCNLSDNADTLNIYAPHVKYIKIDGEIYQVIRSTELKPVVKNIYLGSTLILGDKMPTYTLPDWHLNVIAN